MHILRNLWIILSTVAFTWSWFDVAVTGVNCSTINCFVLILYGVTVVWTKVFVPYLKSQKPVLWMDGIKSFQVILLHFVFMWHFRQTLKWLITSFQVWFSERTKIIISAKYRSHWSLHFINGNAVASIRRNCIHN